MIRIFTGAPGAGKSFGVLRSDLEPELLYGERLIVTNLPLKLPELCAYFGKHYPEWVGDIHNRIRLISLDQTKKFYLYRTPVGQLEDVSTEDSKNGRHVDYDSQRGNGCLYIIDEAQIPFDSREWAATGPELTYYNTQHRKLNDELVFITQSHDFLDGRVRKLAQEFWCFENQGLRKLWTFFRRPSFFTCEVHRKPPTHNGPPPDATYRYRLNLELAAIYDTSAGIGIKGRNMPEKQRKKGVSALWLIIPVVIAFYLLNKVPDWIGKGLSGAANRGQPSPSSRTGPDRPPSEAVPNFGKGVGLGARDPEPSPERRPADPPYVVNYVISPRGLLVTLSNGETLSEGTGIVQMTRDYVVMKDGTSYKIRRGRSTVSASPASAGPH